MINAQLTPTQRDSIERSRAFRAKIAASAVPQKPAAEKPFAVKGDYVPDPVTPDPSPPRMSTPRAMPAETFQPEIVWPVIPEIPSEVFSHIVQIQRVVAAHYNILITDIRSARRTANIVRPRQVAMYLCRTLTNKSYPEIGLRFGGRDHTTVLHAFNKINYLLQRMPELEAEVAAFRASLAQLNGVQR